MIDIFTIIVKDSATLISDFEKILCNPCLLHDDFKTNLNDLDFEWILSDNKYPRIKRIYYSESNDGIIYITSVFFEFTDNLGDMNVQYIKE